LLRRGIVAIEAGRILRAVAGRLLHFRVGGLRVVGVAVGRLDAI
jgi:hypothetical protein